jgi:hypothetical protein
VIDAVMKHINNYFVVDSHDVELNVVNGSADLPFLQEGQYYLIAGSVFNNGVHVYGNGGLTEETPVSVTVYSLAPPKAFLDVVDEITAYQEKNQDVTGYTSESFGGYSYSKGTGTNGAPIGWKEVFSSKLNDWRKL